MARKKKEEVLEENAVQLDEDHADEVLEIPPEGDMGIEPPAEDTGQEAAEATEDALLDEPSLDLPAEHGSYTELFWAADFSETLPPDVEPDDGDSPLSELDPTIDVEPVDEAVEEPVESTESTNLEPVPPAQARPRRKTIFDVDLKSLDRQLSDTQRQEWESIYASFRSKSILTGTVIGADRTSYEVYNRETGQNERRTMHSLIVIGYRVKVLIPETELWFPGEERPGHVLRSMVGSTVDYVIVEIDREGEVAIASRRMAQLARRKRFMRTEHREGDLLICRVVSVGPKRCTVECQGFDIPLSQRDLSYTAIPDLRVQFRPGQELACRFKGFGRETGRLHISVKEASPNPFEGADRRHPPGSRRHAVISGKYAGGVFCTLPDETVCLCLYSPQHADVDFKNGDSVILVVKKFDYQRQLMYGQILSKW